MTAPRPAASAEIDGHQFANHVRVGDRELILYSAAVRKATFLKVDVYSIGLYVPPGSIDQALPGPRAIGATLHAPSTPELEVHGQDVHDRHRLASKSLDDSEQTKAFVLTLLRDVERKKLARCLLDDFRHACGNCPEPVLANAERLAERLPNLSEGDRITYVIDGGTVDVLINDESIGRLDGEPATQAVLDAFLGESAPSDVRNALRTSRWSLVAARGNRD
ncbi:MAG: chalcone isomerase family protein [Candidatus Eisenbacteria bacterium]